MEVYNSEMSQEEKEFVHASVKDEFTYIDDWFHENLPLENKEGDAMDLFVQQTVTNYFRPPGLIGTLPVYDDAEEKIEANKLPKAPKPVGEKVLVFADLEGWCEGIMEKAPEGRVKKSQLVEFAAEFEADNFDLADVERLLKPGWDLVIFGSSLDMPESNSVEDVIAWNTFISKLYWFVIKAIHSNPKCVKRLAVLTRGCLAHETPIHEDGGLGLIGSSSMFGMTNTARLELSMIIEEGFPIQYIDTEYWLQQPNKESLLPYLASECFRLISFGHNTVRIIHTTEGPQRYVMRQLNSKKYAVAKKEFKLPTDGIIGISGGNGALGIVFGGWFVEQCKKQGVGPGLTIQFLSRSVKVADQSAKAWKKIQDEADKIGLKVEQAKLDMSTQQAVDTYIKGCNGQLRGFVHSAGVLEDSMLGTMTFEKFMKVFASKHFGALYLHQALEQIPQSDFQWYWVFGSVAEYGNAGQINYSGSNAFLAALARHRTAMGKKTICMKWGGWGEVGMAATMNEALKKRMEASMLPMFKTKEGLKGMEVGLSTNVPNFSTFKLNPEVMMGTLVECNTTVLCYNRNLYSELMPTVPPPSTDRSDLMTLYRQARGLYTAVAGNNFLVWFNFVADSEEADPEEALAALQAPVPNRGQNPEYQVIQNW